MDLPPELKQGIFLLLAKKELKVVGDVFPDIVNDSYFKARYQYMHYTLYKCCQYGFIEGVKLHLKRTDDVNSPNKGYTWTPLHSAVYNKRYAIIRILLNDPRVEVNVIDGRGKSPLHLAITIGSKDIVKMLLNDPRVNINIINRSGYTPLRYALCYAGTQYLDITKLLKEAGAV